MPDERLIGDVASPEHTAVLAQALTATGKPFDFTTYERAGHAFVSTDRPSFRRPRRRRTAGTASCIDFHKPDRGPPARVAVELDGASARELVHAVLRALDAAPPGLLDDAPILSDPGGRQGA